MVVSFPTKNNGGQGKDGWFRKTSCLENRFVQKKEKEQCARVGQVDKRVYARVVEGKRAGVGTGGVGAVRTSTNKG